MARALFDCWTLCLLETVTDSVVTQEFLENVVFRRMFPLQMQNNL